MGISMLFAFLLLMILGVPLYLSLLSTSLFGIVMLGDFSLLRVMSQQFFGGMDVFSLMAIPFFILAGILMNKTGLTDRLLDFSRLLVGSVRGGLGYVNVVGGIILAGVNGSAAADASALGSILIPAMVKDGFSPPYAAGLTAGSALIGPIIPPSIFMIIYATMTNTSIGGLFAAGILPGILLGGAFWE
ncbi:MAG TPA: TRAP transporter large permease subunit [Synergistales bacterium]|nr:TRAP transporter large permease subunit [Synergistales bacterium]